MGKTDEREVNPNDLLDGCECTAAGDATFVERLSDWIGRPPQGYINAAMRLHGIARRLRPDVPVEK